MPNYSVQKCGRPSSAWSPSLQSNSLCRLQESQYSRRERNPIFVESVTDLQLLLQFQVTGSLYLKKKTRNLPYMKIKLKSFPCAGVHCFVSRKQNGNKNVSQITYTEASWRKALMEVAILFWHLFYRKEGKLGTTSASEIIGTQQKAYHHQQH